MTEVNAKYVIASLLIHWGRPVTYNELCEFGVKVQEELNNNGVKATLMISKQQIKDALDQFPECFEYTLNSEGDIETISTIPTVSAADLVFKFMVYLPVDVHNILLKR